MSAIGALFGTGSGSRQAVVARQERRLRRLVRHAGAKVPYYRALFTQHGVEPDAVRGLEDLRRLPITDRATLQSLDVHEVIAEGVNPDKLIVRRTSGSSGMPLDIRRTWLEERTLGAIRWRAAFAQGARPPDRRAMISYDRGLHPRDSQFAMKAAEMLGLLRTKTFDCFLPDEEMARGMAAYRPDVLAGFAASIWKLAGFVERTGAERPNPRLIQPGGEVTTPEMARTMEATFGAPVRQMYASHEVNLIAWECALGGPLHTCDNSVIVEVLRDGRPAEPGERGEVVVTGLHSFAMPFIRFRLGDVVTLGEANCPCGSSFGTIRSVQGRMNDFLQLPDGRALHAYELIGALALGGARFRQYQVAQEAIDRVVVRVVPENPRFEEEEAPSVLDALHAKLADGVQINLQVVERIEPEANGKFRILRSQLGSAYDGIDWDGKR